MTIGIIYYSRTGNTRAAMKQQELPIKNMYIDLGKYKTLIVGSPVWGDVAHRSLKHSFHLQKTSKEKKLPCSSRAAVNQIHRENREK
jgi:flavodoxin